MRSLRRKRASLVRKVASPPAGADLEQVAHRVSYVGSVEHKRAPSPAGQPRPRADASICDHALSTRFADVLEWLKRAIRAGRVGAYWENGFPRYVWHKEDGVVYEARLINKGLGQYKGYPLEKSEWPQDLR